MFWRSLYPTELGGAMRRLAITLCRASGTIFARACSGSRAGANDRGAVCELLFPRGDGRRIGKRDGVLLHVSPGFVFVLEFVFILKITEGEEQELANEGEISGVAGRDAVLGYGFEEFAEDEVDVRGGHESAGKRSGELGAEAIGFDNLPLGASMEDT